MGRTSEQSQVVAEILEQVLERCKGVFPGWRAQSLDDFEFDAPKGFSSFTMAVRCKTPSGRLSNPPSDPPSDPPAVFYRQLEGKENAILDFDTEKSVFLALGEQGIAARCLYYDPLYRLEEFHNGRTLQPEEIFAPPTQRQIADRLFQLHQLQPQGVPHKPFFELLHEKWGPLARVVLEENRAKFPENERAMCDDLTELYSPATLARVRACMPEAPLVFCHNDTYHGNIMRTDAGEIRLLDFEFSCANYRVYDFANPLAETVMKHGLSDYPYFHIGEPEYGDDTIGRLLGYYLDNQHFESTDDREREHAKLLRDTKNMIMMSDYVYAMAAVPLALHPVQKIRFIPYAHQRFRRFEAAYRRRGLPKDP